MRAIKVVQGENEANESLKDGWGFLGVSTTGTVVKIVLGMPESE
jgi:hypothetical protein